MSDTPVNCIHYLWGITTAAVCTAIIYRIKQREDFHEELKRAGLGDIEVDEPMPGAGGFLNTYGFIRQAHWYGIVDFANKKVDREYSAKHYSEERRA